MANLELQVDRRLWTDARLFFRDRMDETAFNEAEAGDYGIITNTRSAIDVAVNTLNGILNPQYVVEYPELLTNAVILRKVLGDQQLPTLTEAVTNTNPASIKACRRAFFTARKDMKAGDEDPDSGWTIHKIEDDPQKRSDAIGLETFNEYLVELLPDQLQRNHERTAILALEEVIALYHSELPVFENIAEWYTEAEGFSLDMVRLARSQDREIKAKQISEEM